MALLSVLDQHELEVAQHRVLEANQLYMRLRAENQRLQSRNGELQALLRATQSKSPVARLDKKLLRLRKCSSYYQQLEDLHTQSNQALEAKRITLDIQNAQLEKDVQEIQAQINKLKSELFGERSDTKGQIYNYCCLLASIV